MVDIGVITYIAHSGKLWVDTPIDGCPLRAPEPSQETARAKLGQLIPTSCAFPPILDAK